MHHPTRALIVADGAVPERALLDAAWPGWADDVDLVVAADGGAVAAERLGLRPDLLVGDGDSLSEAGLVRIHAAGIPVELSPIAKDETDTELAILAAVRRGAARVTILCALGGPRVDHALANVLLLAHPALAGVPAELLDPAARVSLIRAPDAAGAPVHRPLPGPLDALVSLIPLGDVASVTTAGLAYPLRDEGLDAGPARGVSNVRSSADAAVTVGRGLLLVVEAPATLRP
jgi:thiamine pyrophosphokinase